MTAESWEKVHLYHDTYDGPISGIADCGGIPHLFEKIFSEEEEDEYTSSFHIEPVDEPCFAVMRERNQIWLRWRAALDAGEVGLKSHPALPQDRERYEHLNLTIGGRDKPDPARSRILSARMRKIGKFEWEVRWDLPEA